MSEPLILSVVNLKGGVGKTAIAVSFAAYCGSRGYKTLLIDLDPQTNATFSCMDVQKWQEHAALHGTVADLLGLRSHTAAEGSQKSPVNVVVEGVFPGVDLIPSHLDLFTMDLDLANATARETKLRRALAPVVKQYEIVICDCPPNLTIPTQNALALSTHYAVPVSPDYLSSLGVALLINRVTKLCDELEHKLTLAGIIISRVGRPAFHREQTVATIREQFTSNVLLHQLTERVAVSESAQLQQPVIARNDAAADEFKAVSQELLTRMGVAQ
jgi:chromosome partitioning protein